MVIQTTINYKGKDNSEKKQTIYFGGAEDNTIKIGDDITIDMREKNNSYLVLKKDEKFNKVLEAIESINGKVNGIEDNEPIKIPVKNITLTHEGDLVFKMNNNATKIKVTGEGILIKDKVVYKSDNIMNVSFASAKNFASFITEKDTPLSVHRMPTQFLDSMNDNKSEFGLEDVNFCPINRGNEKDNINLVKFGSRVFIKHGDHLSEISLQKKDIAIQKTSDGLINVALREHYNIGSINQRSILLKELDVNQAAEICKFVTNNLTFDFKNEFSKDTLRNSKNKPYVCYSKDEKLEAQSIKLQNYVGNKETKKTNMKGEKSMEKRIDNPEINGKDKDNNPSQPENVDDKKSGVNKGSKIKDSGTHVTNINTIVKQFEQTINLITNSKDEQINKLIEQTNQSLNLIGKTIENFTAVQSKQQGNVFNTSGGTNYFNFGGTMNFGSNVGDGKGTTIPEPPKPEPPKPEPPKPEPKLEIDPRLKDVTINNKEIETFYNTCNKLISDYTNKEEWLKNYYEEAKKGNAIDKFFYLINEGIINLTNIDKQIPNYIKENLPKMPNFDSPEKINDVEKLTGLKDLIGCYKKWSESYKNKSKEEKEEVLNKIKGYQETLKTQEQNKEQELNVANVVSNIDNKDNKEEKTGTDEIVDQNQETLNNTANKETVSTNKEGDKPKETVDKNTDENKSGEKNDGTQDKEKIDTSGSTTKNNNNDNNDLSDDKKKNENKKSKEDEKQQEKDFKYKLNKITKSLNKYKSNIDKFEKAINANNGKINQIDKNLIDSINEISSKLYEDVSSMDKNFGDKHRQEITKIKYKLIAYSLKQRLLIHLTKSVFQKEVIKPKDVENLIEINKNINKMIKSNNVSDELKKYLEEPYVKAHEELTTYNKCIENIFNNAKEEKIKDKCIKFNKEIKVELDKYNEYNKDNDKEM